MQKPYETETREKDGIEYTIGWHGDCDWVDLSHLGEFTSKLTAKTEWYVDRSKGHLLGDTLEEPYEGDFTDEDKFDEARDEWDENSEEILADSLETWSRPFHDHRYFVPDNHQGVETHYAKEPHEKMVAYYNEHVKDKLYGYGIVEPKEMTPETLGKVTSALYACQNYSRACGYGRDWWMVYIQVSIYHDGEEVSSAGCSTESDWDHKELIDDLMYEALAELSKQADHYEHIAEWIRNVTTEKETL